MQKFDCCTESCFFNSSLLTVFKQFEVVKRSPTQPCAKWITTPKCIPVTKPCRVAQESSRAQKRKQKVTAQGAEREARIAMELAEAGDSERQLEEAALRELLMPLGLAVRDIQARCIPLGECMQGIIIVGAQY